MGKNVANIALAVVALAGAGAAWLAYQKWSTIDEELVATAAEKEALERELAAAERSIVKLRGQVEDLEATLTANPAGAGGQAGVAGTDPEANKDKQPFASMMKGMRDDPAMKEMLADQQKFMVDKLYSPLLDILDLTEEEREKLRAMLKERQVFMMEQGMELMGGDKSAEEMQALAAELGEQQIGWQDQIKEVIGEENYEKFDRYEKSQQERHQIKTFKDSLEGTAFELTYDQEEALMAAMYEERTNFKFTKDVRKNAELGPGGIANFSPEMMETFMEENKLLQEKTFIRAAEILSPEQLESFRKSQEQSRSMQEFGMKMGLQMMGNTSTKVEVGSEAP